jgi:hypothetical protein
VTEYILTAAIFAFAGLIQGVTGFGSLLFAVPLLALYLAPQVSVPLATLCGLFVVVVMGFKLRRHLERSKILPILLGSLPGVVIGVAVLKGVDAGVFRLLLGSMITGYALFALLARPRPRKLHWGVGSACGFLAGAFSAVFSAGGPPVIIYTTMQDWTPDQKRATITGFYLAASIFVAVGHASVGLTTGHVLQLTAAAAPSIYAGVRAGLHLAGRINPATYMRLVQLLLLAMGLMLLFT